MSKITKTFAGGTPLAASDLNQMASAINDNDTQIGRVKQAIGYDESGETHLNAWGLVFDPNSANSELETVGNFAFWNEFKQRIGRYQINNAGTKAVKLDTHNSELYADGTAVDHTKGHIMALVPDLYYRVYPNPTTGKVTLWMSATPLGGHAIHTSGEGHGSWIGAYLGRIIDGKLTSRPGGKPSAEQTINSFFNYAQANSQEFGLSDYQQRKLMIMLYLSEYHNEDSQAKLGNGMTGTGNNWDHSYMAPTGATATLGDSCGNVPYTANGSIAGACHVSLFGIEDPYGWYWEMIQGCYFGNSDNAEQNGTEMFLYDGNRMPTSAEIATLPAGDYRQLTRPTTSNNVYSLQMGEYFDILPGKLGGGGWGDYHYANTTGQLLLWGGGSNYGSHCGLVCSNSHYAFSNSTSDFAARLACYGQPDIVSREQDL